MKLFTLDPTPGHWVAWILLAAITLLFLGILAEVGYKAFHANQRLKEWERQQEQLRRLTPPRPHPRKDRDAMAGEYRKRGLL